MKVVLDANVFISASILRGRLNRITELWISGKICPVATTEMIEEYRQGVKNPKFKLQSDLQTQIIEKDFLPFYEAAIPSPPPPPTRCRDKDDEIYLLAAMGSQAEILVSGDKDLLARNGSYPFPILSPADFLSRYFPENK